MKVSIITVCYNSEATIRDTIESVLSQSYSDIEYIIVDGASTDGTMSIIKDYEDKIAKVVSEKDNGIYDAMNKGIGQATGDVIGILNSDDIYASCSVIDDVVEGFSESGDVDALLGDVKFFHSGNVEKSVRSYSAKCFKPWMLRFGLMPPHPPAFVKQSAYERVGNYKVGYKIGADFDFFVRLFYSGNSSYKVSKKTWVMMRVGGVSTSGLKSYIVSTQEMLKSLKENEVYSNALFVLTRLPVKFLQMYRP